MNTELSAGELRAVRLNGDVHVVLGVGGEAGVVRAELLDDPRLLHLAAQVQADLLAIADGGVGIGEGDAVFIEGLDVLLVPIRDGRGWRRRGDVFRGGLLGGGSARALR